MELRLRQSYATAQILRFLNWRVRQNRAAFGGFSIFSHFDPSAWYPVCLALCSVKTSEACRIAWLAQHVFSQALNSIDLLSEWQTQQMLTLSNAQCLSSPCFLPCYGSQTRWAAPATWLWATARLRARVCECVCKWVSMNVHVYVTNRPASGVPYQAGLMLTSILSTSSAVDHSAVAGHSEKLICALAEKVNN